MTEPRAVLRDEVLYLGDNGACFCGAHAGTAARYTGRDLSGQRVLRVTPEAAAEALAEGVALACEACAARRRGREVV